MKQEDPATVRLGIPVLQGREEVNDRRSHDPFAPPPASLTGAVAPPAQDPEPEPLPDNLDDLLKADLVALAEQRGVAADGTKAEIIARLRAAVGNG